ncbi:MAG TPA: hypothetical protein VL068_11470 [Microthrixaceae bacterium]|nr:hypothetical protein [Microthrixaceae bacterium]
MSMTFLGASVSLIGAIVTRSTPEPTVGESVKVHAAIERLGMVGVSLPVPGPAGCDDPFGVPCNVTFVVGGPDEICQAATPATATIDAATASGAIRRALVALAVGSAGAEMTGS